MANRILVLLVLVAAALGFAFAAVSTSDFVAHLDRQVHGIHCSFLPGVDAPDVSGSSGCHVTLMSPYSSVLRDRIWGGIPISLPAMAVFAYLALAALAIVVLERAEDPRATGFLTLATVLPFATSVGMGVLSIYELGTACKLCIGIYVSSTLGLLFSAMAFLRARSAAAAMPPERLGPAPRIGRRVPRLQPIDLSEVTGDADSTIRDDDRVSLGTADTIAAPPGRKLATASEMDARIGLGRDSGAAADDPAPIGWGAIAIAVALGVVFVLVPTLAYAAGAPDFERYLGACGTLAHPEDPSHVLVPLGPQTGGTEVIEVLDPLCPACRGFEQRFAALPAAQQVSRRALLFPADSECNWMLDRQSHAGACVLSEAVLCAAAEDGAEDAEDVIAWAFENQESIRTATEADPGAALRMVRERFPGLRSCVGTPEARARVNRSLRWAVANELPVLTPQVYVGGTRVCDADIDLGLDWTLARLLERRGSR